MARFAGVAALALVMAVLAASSSFFEVTALPAMVGQAAKFQKFRDSLLSGVFDEAAGSYEIYTEEQLQPALAYLRDQRLSLFGTAEAASLGRPISDLGTAAPASACSGSAAARSDPELGPRGVRLQGSAWDEGRNRSVRRILLADRNGVLVGFGSPERPEGRPRVWTGYAKADVGSVVASYALLKDGRLCPLGTASVAPGDERLPAAGQTKAPVEQTGDRSLE